MNQSELERTFETHWRQLGGPELEKEYRFHPTRRWRLDFAYISDESGLKVGIECEGGTFKRDKSRHTTGKGYSDDCQKYNQAQLLGWQIYRLTADMLANDPAGHLQPIIDLMKCSH